MKILVINGVNLNMLGIREPEIYGSATLKDLEAVCLEAGRAAGAEIECFSSNYEGEIVEKIQRSYRVADGIVINAGAYSHTSIAILDALKAVGIPTVEVHITDVSKREAFRQTDYIKLYAEKFISGKGFAGYEEAIEYLSNRK